MKCDEVKCDEVAAVIERRVRPETLTETVENIASDLKNLSRRIVVVKTTIKQSQCKHDRVVENLQACLEQAGVNYKLLFEKYNELQRRTMGAKTPEPEEGKKRGAEEDEERRELKIARVGMLIQSQDDMLRDMKVRACVSCKNATMGMYKSIDSGEKEVDIGKLRILASRKQNVLVDLQVKFIINHCHPNRTCH